VASAIGAVIALATAFAEPWQLAVLTGWDAAAVALLAWIWFSIGSLTASETREVATREDDSRAAAFLLLLVASTVSLVGVILAFIEADDSHGARRVLLDLASVGGVLLSWAVVHTVFALRYAHIFYTDVPGGIDFKDESLPDYYDFAYVAFTVGMTFQVSDTDVTSRPMRRAVLRHAVLSWLFGAIIVAMTINLIAGLVR
jgi:uncharacterized membrane protein